MNTGRAQRGRADAEAEVLDALVERGEEGMTVLELRAAVDADIDTIEDALPSLKADGLIVVDTADGTTTIKPNDRLTDRPDAEPEPPSLIERLRRLVGL